MATKYTFLFGILFSFIGFAQDGSPDISFGNNGIVETDIDGDWDFGLGITQQSDGKLLVAGEGIYQSNDYATLTRYLSDGSLDFSFGTNGLVLKSSENGFNKFSFVKSFDSNKIIAGMKYGGNLGGFKLARFFENGDIDTSFGVNGDLNLTPSDESVMGLQCYENGSFLTIGETTNSPTEIILRKYLVSGETDTSFGINGSVTILVGNNDNFSIELNISDTIDVLIKTQENNIPQFSILQFSPNGVLNTSFGNNGIADIPGNETSCSFITTSNNKFVVRCMNNESKYFLRLLANGNLDTAFGNDGSFTYTFPFNSFLVQENQRIILYGNGQDPLEGGGYLDMVRYDDNGSIDSNFNYTNTFSEVNNSNAIIQSNGKIVVVGSTMWYNGSQDIVLFRFNNNPLGNEDHLFNKQSVYPNPSEGIFNISHDFITAETTFQISDITGKIIQQGNISGNHTQIDISQFENGIYLFTSEGRTMRLIKY